MWKYVFLWKRTLDAVGRTVTLADIFLVLLFHYENNILSIRSLRSVITYVIHMLCCICVDSECAQSLWNSSAWSKIHTICTSRIEVGMEKCIGLVYVYNTTTTTTTKCCQIFAFHKNASLSDYYRENYFWKKKSLS